MKRTKLLLTILLFGIATMAFAQPKAVPVRWFHVGKDSVMVEYALAESRTPRPAIVVLSDRFGMQTAVSSIVSILAQQGFHAFAIPLRSAPQHVVAGIPDVVLDSVDYRTVIEIAADISSDPVCSGRVGMLGFDIGATIGAVVSARLPMFTANVLFYPALPDLLVPLIPDIASPLLINVGEYDGQFPLARVNEIKESCIEKGRKIKVGFYKEAKRFFFNPKHEDSHKKNTQAAWMELLTFFKRNLS